MFRELVSGPRGDGSICGRVPGGQDQWNGAMEVVVYRAEALGKAEVLR